MPIDESYAIPDELKPTPEQIAASAALPAFEQIADEDREVVLNNLELNDSVRLQAILRAHALTLDIRALRAIINE